MKSLKKELSISRKGAGILLAISFLGIGITTVVLSFNSRAIGYYKSTRTLVDGFRARELAHAGLEAGLLTLRSIPEKFLFTLGFIASSPRLLLSEICTDEGTCTKYYVSYGIEPEDGKFNLNHLVGVDDQIYTSYQEILSRLFETLELDPDTIGAIIDWIDSNNFASTGGAEKEHYESLEPPRKIKNTYLYSLSELCVVKGFSQPLIYNSRIPSNFLEEREKRASISDTERGAIGEEDWTLASNVTAYLPTKLLGTEKININVAPYHVLASLSELVTAKEVLAIFKLKNTQEGYIENKKAIEELPELQVPSTLPGITLGKALVGTGKTSGWIKTKSRFYRITGVGYITIASDNNEKVLATRKIWGLWDKTENAFIYFSEDE